MTRLSERDAEEDALKAQIQLYTFKCRRQKRRIRHLLSYNLSYTLLKTWFFGKFTELRPFDFFFEKSKKWKIKISSRTCDLLTRKKEKMKKCISQVSNQEHLSNSTDAMTTKPSSGRHKILRFFSGKWPQRTELIGSDSDYTWWIGYW